MTILPKVLQIWRWRYEAKDHAWLQRIRMFGTMITYARAKVIHDVPAVSDISRPNGLKHLTPGRLSSARF